jgi:hypothetical protein
MRSKKAGCQSQSLEQRFSVLGRQLENYGCAGPENAMLLQPNLTVLLVSNIIFILLKLALDLGPHHYMIPNTGPA